MRKRINSYAARPREEERHSFSKIRRVVDMKKQEVEDNKRCNDTAENSHLKEFTEREAFELFRSLHPGMHLYGM